MSSLFNCWSCNKSLLGREDFSEDIFFFCNTDCKETHEALALARAKKRSREEAAADRLWKKERAARDAVCAAIREGKPVYVVGKKPPKAKKLAKKHKKVVGKKVTVKRVPNTSSKKGSIKYNRARIRRLGEGRRTVTCSKCDAEGHNSRTCKSEK